MTKIIFVFECSRILLLILFIFILKGNIILLSESIDLKNILTEIPEEYHKKLILTLKFLVLNNILKISIIELTSLKIIIPEMAKKKVFQFF